MTLARWIPAWIALAAFPLLASAQTASDEQPIDLFDLSAPSFTTFSSRDGVPESVTVAAQTDAQGFVWIASPLGLARYDGRRWSLLDDPALSSSVFDLMLDHAGTLWASFRDRGIAHYDGSHWRVENHATGLPTEHVRRLVETTDTAGRSQLWALTWDDGLLLFRDGHWLEDPGNAQLPRGPVLSLAATRTLGGHERLWIGTYNEGVWFREDGRWQQLSVAHFAPSQIEDLFTTSHDGHEELWISAYGAGLWRLNESGLRSWTMESGDLPTNQVYDIAETALPNGNRAIWVASRSGLIRIYNDRAQVFDRRNGLPSDVIRGLSAWRSPEGIQVLWLATEFGVARTIIGANQWKSATLMGARANGVFNLLVEPSAAGERLWVASTGDGLGLFEQGQWRYFSTADGSLPDTDVRMIKNVPDADGKPQLWVGERYGYLLQVNEGPRFQLVATPWARHVGEAVMDMLSRKIDGVYEQWVVTRQSGLYLQRNGVWTPFRPDSAVGQWRTVKLLEQIDAQGKSWLWASSNLGLSRFDGERWTLLGRDAGLPDVETSGLTLIPDAQSRQILWIGTAHSGIARMDVSDALHPVMLPADLPPPPDSNAYSAMNDSQGRIFICTNNGVQLLTAKPGGYASQVFTRRDGMVHDECNTNAQFIDAHDRYWTGTLGGVTVFDPEREIRDEHAKPLKITATVIDGVSAARESAQVPSGAHEVRVDFALLSWQRESESRFRTQLVGYESAPGAWSAQNYRDFSALPPGDYLLRVEARDYAGNLSAPVEFPISVIPTWWQMAWARMLFGLLALLMVYAVLQWRTRSLNAQRRRLEEQVAGRNAELHVANARLLELSYKDALTGLANRRRLLESLEPGASAKMTAGAATALIFVDVDHFKSYNDRFGHPAGDEALRCVAERMQACVPPAALVARYGGEEFACLLPNADTPTARALAEKIRAAVESCDVPLPGTATINRVTISAGVASRQLVSAADAHALLRDADIALYQAKRDGRNCARG